jgi:hypothetical protein
VEGDEIPTPSDDRSRAVERKEQTPYRIKSTYADQGTPLNEIQSDKREEAKEERMETNRFLNGKKK